MNMQWPARDLWQQLLPRDARWARAQAVALGLLVLAVLVYWMIPNAPEPVPTVLAAPPPTHRQLPADLADEVRQRFPVTCLPESEQLLCLSRLGSLAEEMGLTLVKRRLGDMDRQRSPARRPVHLTTVGPPSAQIRWVRSLQASAEPIVLRKLDWRAGEGPEKRSLAVVVEMFAD